MNKSKSGDFPSDLNKRMPPDSRVSLYSWAPKTKTSTVIEMLRNSQPSLTEDPCIVWPDLMQLLDLKDDKVVWLEMVKKRYDSFAGSRINYLDNALKFNEQMVSGEKMAQDGSNLLDPDSASITQEQKESGKLMHSFLPQVIDGDAVVVGEYGFICRILYSSEKFTVNERGMLVPENRGNMSFLCTGTILAPRIVVTASHCVADSVKGTHPSRQHTKNDYDYHFAVHFGYVNQAHAIAESQRVPGFWKTKFAIAKDVAMFPLYYPGVLYGDITLFFLDRDIPFSRDVFPCALPSVDLVWENQVAVGAGWGKAVDSNEVRNPVLLQHQVRVQPISDRAIRPICQNPYKFGPIHPLFYGAVCNSSIDSSQSFCSGDSGGPTFFRPSGGNKSHTLLAVTSFGVSKQCNSQSPTISASVPHHLGWIKKVILSRNFR